MYVTLVMMPNLADSDTGQANAAIECIVPDAGDADGDRDAGQAAAIIECLLDDVGHAAGGCVTSRLSPRTLDE